MRYSGRIVGDTPAMIIVTGTVTFDPSDWPAFEAMWDTARAATLAEDGCLSYDLYPVRGSDSQALLFEQWRDYDSLKAHWAAPHLVAFREARQELGELTFDITLFDATAREE